MERPTSLTGLRHLALYVNKLTECVDFYCNLLGMKIDWQPDEDNYYLSSGSDNLALHRAPKADQAFSQVQRLDHLGFAISSLEQVDEWYNFLKKHNVNFRTAPKTHRDGARSFYCEDPDGNVVQIIYHQTML